MELAADDERCFVCFDADAEVVRPECACRTLRVHARCLLRLIEQQGDVDCRVCRKSYGIAVARVASRAVLRRELLRAALHDGCAILLAVGALVVFFFLFFTNLCGASCVPLGVIALGIFAGLAYFVFVRKLLCNLVERRAVRSFAVVATPSASPSVRV